MADNTSLLSEFESRNRAIQQITGFSREYYNSLIDACKKIARFRDELYKNQEVREMLRELGPHECDDLNEKLNFFFCVDAIRCYQGMGIENVRWSSPFYCISFFSATLIAENYSIRFESIVRHEQLIATQADFCSSLSAHCDDFCEPSHLAVPSILPNDDYLQRYLVLLYRWASLVAKVDNVITEQEQEWLSSLMNTEKWKTNRCGDKTYLRIDTIVDIDSLNPLERLKELVGLFSVKKEIESLYNYAKVQKQREQMGLKNSDISYHCVFTGNAGTGKTTVARIVAEIYKELGIIKGGQLIETDRSGLVAEYVGQTAIKTNKIIDSALDGVLFVDEAYALADGGREDYGKEAISTLVKRMEDNRNRLVVILAGYGSDMKRFIDSNLGLKSRFSRYIDFPDYTADELFQIFLTHASKYDYLISDGAKDKLKTVLFEAVAHKDVSFGNARYVRNLFEKTIERQANRLALVPNITPEILSIITEDDISTL